MKNGVCGIIMTNPENIREAAYWKYLVFDPKNS
jgi:hypothetical protein